MSHSDQTVLVTGATGRQGGAVIRRMLPKGWKLRALTRHPANAAAQDLARQGIEVVQGDLEDPTSLERALRGAYGVYSVQDFWAVGATREVEQGKQLADAAKKASVAHFVYSSVGGAERNSGIDHWQSKWEIENHIRQLGLPATILRPVAFMENYYIDQVEISILKGKLLDPIRADKPYQTIAIDDIGAFAALAFERPREFIGLELEIAGSALTNPKPPKFSAAFWANRCGFASCQCCSFGSCWAKSSIKCSAGSTRPASRQTSPSFVADTPKSIFRLWKNGCATKAGTNAPAASSLPKAHERELTKRIAFS